MARSADVALARRAARSTRLGAVILGAVAALMVSSTAVTYVQTFPTAADRAQLSTVTASGGLSVLFGPTAAIGTVGGYTFYKGFVTLSAIAAVWAVLVTTRALRGEEDAGRWPLLLAGPTQPARATGATLVGLLVPVGALFVGVALGTIAAGADGRVGFGPLDAFVHGAAVASVAAVFVAVGACASQIAGTRRGANGIGLGAVGLAFVVRMIGDAGPSTRWVRWATPFGWPELVKPLTANHLLPLAAPVVATAVLALAAIWAAARRDVGSGLVAGSDRGRLDPRGLASVNGFSLRLERGNVIAWLVGAAAMGAAFGVVAQIADGAAPASTRDLLERFGVAGSFLHQYVGLVMLFVAAVLALVGASHVAAAAREELDGRLTLLLAQPTRRTGWLLGRLVIAAATLVVASLLTGLAMWAAARLGGTDPGLATVVGAALNVVPVCLVALGVGAIVLAVAPRVAAPAVYVLVGWSLVVDIVASLVDSARWLSCLGLFHSLVLVPARPADPATTVGLLVVAVALSGTAVAAFGRRDLQAA